MAKNSIIGIVNELISKRLGSMQMTDVVIGVVRSTNPFSISIMNEVNDITIPQELIDIDSFPADVKVGDRFRFLRYSHGNRFLVLGKKIGG